MSNVTDFPTEPKRDLIAEMKGPETCGNAVILEGKLIPNMMMFDRGHEIEFVLDNRLVFGFPREFAHQAACFAASAMAIGDGFPHFSGGKHFTQREFASNVTCLGEMPPQS
ncbi:MAG: hypothetical protein NVS3B5_01650 [Sphingomicrobium sp.]